MLTNTKNSQYSKLIPLQWNQVKWNGGFWEDIMRVFSTKTVSHIHEIFENEEISHMVENFRICADKSDIRSHIGPNFGDGDFYKWLEAVIYARKYNNGEWLQSCLDEYIDLIIKSQLSDGYISTKQIINERNGIKNRMEKINAFEIYNMGHLLTLSCIYYRVTGKDKLLKAGEKAADYLEEIFEAQIENDQVMTAVCPAHYMGLIELYRTTGKKKYLVLAEKMIESRDRVANGSDDNQDRVILKTQKKIVGHAVRATYLYAGVADLYAETGDIEYLDMLHRVWDNMINYKTYITGGIGSVYNGASPYGYFLKHALVHQAFGYEYQLPNITAYNETCASVGLILWAYRMFLVEAKASYMDMIERSFYNVLLASVNIEGNKFFYENVLRRTKKLEYRLIWPLTRCEYLKSFCCPPNVARTVLQSSEYAYAVHKNEIYIGLYGNNCAAIEMEMCSFELEQITEYPYSGKIHFVIRKFKGQGSAKIQVRIPGWVSDGKIVTKNSCIYINKEQANTYVGVNISQEQKDVYIEFEMKARFIEANPLVEECINQVAVERGPLVYCLESCDIQTETLDDVWISLGTELIEVEMEIENRKVVALETEFYVKRKGFEKADLYRRVNEPEFDKVQGRLIPYFCWDNRGTFQHEKNYDAKILKYKLDMPDSNLYDEMKVWLPVLYSVNEQVLC